MSKRDYEQTMRDAVRAAKWVCNKIEAGEEIEVSELAKAMGTSRRTVIRDIEHLIEFAENDEQRALAGTVGNWMSSRNYTLTEAQRKEIVALVEEVIHSAHRWGFRSHEELCRCLGVPVFSMTRWFQMYGTSPLSLAFSQKVYMDEFIEAGNLGALAAMDALIVEEDSLLSMRWDLIQQRLEPIRQMSAA